MHYLDEVFTIVASKLNNDIASIIMKMFKSPMQCIFEKAYDLDDSIVIPLEKDNHFKSFNDAVRHYNLRINYDRLEKILLFLRQSHFSNFTLFEYEKMQAYLHYQNFLLKCVIENTFNPKTTLFVIRNNKIFLKKGEITTMRMSEIVDLTGKVAIYALGSPVCILEKGDIACSFLSNSYGGWGIYAIEDTIITFDSYIMNDVNIRSSLYNKGCNVTNFCYKKEDGCTMYDKYKYIPHNVMEKYNLPKDYLDINRHITNTKISEYFYKFFLWPDT
jgi:hypothetical protein